ncbi:PRC-barrel domain protein [Paraburkholderia sp. BL27I4N3]|nr:PRC-barrel domain protein [Paraburkholderia sp. BL27I4N3]
MTTLDRKTQAQTGSTGANIVGSGVGDGPGPDVMASATLDDTKVISSDGEHVGKVSDIMLDVRSGRIAYAVLAEGAMSSNDRPCFRSAG